MIISNYKNRMPEVDDDSVRMQYKMIANMVSYIKNNNKADKKYVGISGANFSTNGVSDISNLLLAHRLLDLTISAL